MKHPNLIITATTIVALIVFAAYILVGMYPDVLITAQDRNWYAGDYLFFHDTIAKPFGLFMYVGSYLTQFFYYPALGAAMLIAIWAVTTLVGIRTFRLEGMWQALMIVPAACFLVATVDLGYWIYCLNIVGYWFSQSVAYLCLMLLLWTASATPRRFRAAWYIVIGFAAFPAFGWFSYLFTICLALSQFGKEGEKRTKPSWVDALGILVTLAAPIVFHALLYEGTMLKYIFQAGFPLFETSTDESLRPSIPFFILIAATLFLSLCKVLPTMKKVPAFAAYLIVGAASVYGVWNSIFKDDNYVYEMQMTQASMCDDWRGVISIAEKTKTPSRTMVMLKNIALMNTGEVAERSFELSNDGQEINNPDSLNVNIMQIASAVIYYNYGKVNYGMRWAIEFAVSYGFSPYQLKIMARCAEATGEKALQKRYTDRLNRLTFYNDWKAKPTTPIVKELQTVLQDALTSDHDSCERFLISLLANTRKADSPLITEQSLLYSMINRNSQTMKIALYDYAKLCKDDYLPKAYEELYVLLEDKIPYKVRVKEETRARFKSFMDTGNRYAEMGYTEDNIKEAMREDWEDSYFWFNAFGRNMY